MTKRRVKHQLHHSQEIIQSRRALSVAVHHGKLTAHEQREYINEINELAEAAQLDVLATQPIKISKPHPAYYLGLGKVEALQSLLTDCQARQLVFNCDLTVTQAHNLEKKLEVKILDRTDVILNIFSRRATSYEGKLQVELAYCRRQMARLAGLWTHLERQRGGIGVRGGPGEKQIELDRRLLANKVRRLEAKIDKMTQRNLQARQRRRKNKIMTAALVGYTNAGKSTLFNLLAQENAVADDRLFVTLNSTARRARTTDGHFYILSDTVGFIRNLPHELIAGFRATLANAVDSDLLIIVVDAANSQYEQHLQLTEDLLTQINSASRQRIVVFNKIDDCDRRMQVESGKCDRMHAVCLSCRTREGLPLLQRLITNSVNRYLSEI